MQAPPEFGAALHPRETLRSARTNLIVPSRERKDADHKSGPSPEGYGPQGGGPRLVPRLEKIPHPNSPPPSSLSPGRGKRGKG